MQSVREVIVVEGRYDKNALRQVVDAVVIEGDFEPKKAVVDPDVRTLMLNRKLAEADVTGVTQATSPTSAR